MQDTHGLDALATLCGFTAAATSGETVPCDLTSAVLSQQQTAGSAMASLLAQQQQIQQQQQAQHQKALQVQQVLTMHRATAAQHQQQRLQQQIINLPSQFVEQAQQIERLLAMQQVQQQQQPVMAYGQGLQALANQFLVAQQQHVNSGSASLPFHSSTTFSQLKPSPPAMTLSPAMALSVAYQAVNINNNQTTQLNSPSTLAMPPPSNVAPTVPGNYFAKSTTGTDAEDISNSWCKTSNPTKQEKPLPKQTPIYDIISEWEDKKQAKRAANRLSAHLSRKRKKVFMDDLKDENSELRRKEQILRSIPDLIVVFDASGLISFVSHSVTRFMNYTVEELEETSFWDKLTEESVRLIKSAFMDALAVKRSPDEDCTPLINGESISVTLIQKRHDDDDGVSREDEDRHLLVSLKGVVHFGGEYPECVCSIRPEVVASFNNMDPATKETPQHISATTVRSRKRQGQESADPSSVGEGLPSHQVSDIDSEKS